MDRSAPERVTAFSADAVSTPAIAGLAKFLVDLGVPKATLFFTAAIVTASVGICYGIYFLVIPEKFSDPVAIVMPILVPLLLTPVSIRGVVILLIRLRAAEKEAIAARLELERSLDYVSDGFALYDEDDRLVRCNRVYREIDAATADVIVPGVRFENILRAGLARGWYAVAEDEKEAWLAEHLRARYAGERTVQLELGDGRWFEFDNRRTEDGYLVSTFTDISSYVRHQADLAASREQFRQLLENSRVVPWEFDTATMRFTYVGPQAVDLFG